MPRVKENGNWHLVSVEGTKGDCDPLPVHRGSYRMPILCLPEQLTLRIVLRWRSRPSMHRSYELSKEVRHMHLYAKSPNF